MSNSVTPPKIQEYLSQFVHDDVIDLMTQALERILVIGRPEFNQAFSSFVESNKDFATASIVPFGSPHDSSSIVGYMVVDSGNSSIDLSEALKIDRPIVFVDDFISSGGQADTIICEMFNKTPDVELNEEKRFELTDEQRQQLISRPIAFVFAAGCKAGKDKLESRIEELGLTASVYLGLTDDDLPSIYDLKKDPGFSDFEEYCKIVGRELLADRLSDWGKEKLEQRILGYGNMGLLITFPYNTPTQSLTCLWKKGQAKGLDWNPLLPRRAKK